MEAELVYHFTFLFIALFLRTILNVSIYWRLHEQQQDNNSVMTEAVDEITVLAYASIVFVWLRYQRNTILLSTISTLLGIMSIFSLARAVEILIRGLPMYL